MSSLRSRAGQSVTVAAALLIGGAACGYAASASSAGSAVTFKESFKQTHPRPARFGLPSGGVEVISGSYVVAGGIRDHGRLRGEAFGVFGRVNGQFRLIGTDSILTLGGSKGGVVLTCRERRIVWSKTGLVLRAYGQCVSTFATGIYQRLAPVSSRVVIPTGRDAKFTYLVSYVRTRTVGA